MSTIPDNLSGNSTMGSGSPDTSSADTLSGRGPATSPFPTSADHDTATAKATGGDLLNRVVQGAHETIDRLAETAAPHVERLEQNLGGASDKLHEQADEWTDTLRTTVREHPLAAVGAALALGMLVARLAR